MLDLLASKLKTASRSSSDQRVSPRIAAAGIGASPEPDPKKQKLRTARMSCIHRANNTRRLADS